MGFNTQAQGQPGQGSNPPGSPSGKGSMPSQLMQVQPPGQAQNTVTSGQPIMGQPNQYMNTIGQNQQPFSYGSGNGKGKG